MDIRMLLTPMDVRMEVFMDIWTDVFTNIRMDVNAASMFSG